MDDGATLRLLVLLPRLMQNSCRPNLELGLIVTGEWEWLQILCTLLLEFSDTVLPLWPVQLRAREWWRCRRGGPVSWTIVNEAIPSSQLSRPFRSLTPRATLEESPI